MPESEKSCKKTNDFSIEKACKSYNKLNNLRDVVESHQDESAKNLGLSIVYLLNNDFSKVLESLKYLAQTHPDIGLIDRRIAEIYINQNNFEAAVNYLEKAVELDKDDLTAKFWLSLGYFAIGNKKKAEIYLKSLRENVFLLQATDSNSMEQEN